MCIMDGVGTERVEHWYLLAEDRFREALERAARGESVDIIMAETWSESHSCGADHSTCEQQELHTGVATFSLDPGTD